MAKARTVVGSPARKGDAVVVTTEHSITYKNLHTERYRRYELATVTRADRSGLVKAVRRAGYASDWAPHSLGLMTIKDDRYQAAARALIAEAPPGGVSYTSQEALRSAIRRRAEALESGAVDA